MQLNNESDTPTAGSNELAEAHKARKEERYSDALEWYQKSVESGNPRATWELSILYAEEQWGLIDIMGYHSDELLLKAAEMGFEPAMMDYVEENHRLDIHESKYYRQVIDSKDPYVIAGLFHIQLLTVGPQNLYQCQILIKLYKDAIKAGYFNCYANVVNASESYLSNEERSQWLLEGASNGDHYLQCELGLCFDARSKADRLSFSTSDNDALRWYLQSSKQSNLKAMKKAQRIYFDKSSECCNRYKGIELVVRLSELSAKRQFKAFAGSHIPQHSLTKFKVLLERLRFLGFSHKISSDDLKEMWIYGRLLIMFPIIGETLKSGGYPTDQPSANRCVKVYSECTEKARHASVTFLLLWKKSPRLWILNRDVATVIAKEIYVSRSDPKEWL